MTHELKTWPEYYQLVESGLKRFEIRKDDRHFRDGDRLHLREWDAVGGYSGRECTVSVDYVFRGGGTMGLHAQYVIMSISRLYE